MGPAPPQGKRDCDKENKSTTWHWTCRTEGLVTGYNCREKTCVKYIGLPIPFKKKKSVNLDCWRNGLCKFWSCDENVFSSVNSSLVLGLSAVVGCCSLLSRVKDQFQLAPVNWPSCRQQAFLFMHGHGRAAFPILLQILLLFQILGHRCRIRYKRPSILIPRTTRPHRSLRTVCPLLPVTLPSLQVSLQVSKSN